MKKLKYIYEQKNVTLPPGTLFLDIETTGFQRTSTFLTIIGLAWQNGEQIIIEQWFNETGMKEEPLLLLELERFLKERKFSCLIHFNGTTFDLPYLKAKYDQYHLPTCLCDLDSIDLYKLAKKYKDFLQLDGLKQKNLEEAFGLYREDKLSGGELIEVYLEGIRHKDHQLINAYLLHNKEDMEGMIFLWNLVKLDQFFQGDFEIIEWTDNAHHSIKWDEEIIEKQEVQCSSFSNHICIVLETNIHFHYPINISKNNIDYYFSSKRCELRIPIINRELRYFYPNYKDYFYLPAEDCAIHKSVATYVEKDYRQKATRETCYIKKTASFLPLPLPVSTRQRKEFLEKCCGIDLFYKCYGDCMSYVLHDMQKSDCRYTYVKQLIAHILN